MCNGLLAHRRSGRTDDRTELDGVHRHAGCLGTFGRSGSAGLLFGFEHLDRDPVRVVDGYEVGAQETGGPLIPAMSPSRPRLASARSAMLAWITLA